MEDINFKKIINNIGFYIINYFKNIFNTRIKNKLVINNSKKKYYILFFLIIILIILYFILIYKRVPRYLYKLNKLIKARNIRSLSSKSSKFLNKYKLCDFYIASSYKSYLPCTNYYDYSHITSIESVLKAGARYIDLDIFNKNFNENTDPIVCNGKEKGNWHYTTYIDLDKCCKIISKLAFSNEISNYTDPLFLNLNLYVNDNYNTINKIAKILIKYFSHKFLPKKFSYCGINLNDSKKSINIALQPIKIFINKVIIICDYNVKDTNLAELINISSNKFGNFRNMNYIKLKETFNLKEVTNYNKKNLTKVVPYQQSLKRLKTNINYAIPWYLGCQFICMNYNIIDDYFNAYLKRFNKYSFVLKPYKLRYKK